MELLQKIRAALPWLPPDQADDIIAEVALLVLEGRIEESNIRFGIDKFLPSLRKKYRGAEYEISLDQPIGDEEGSAILGDVVHKSAPLLRRACPNCRKKVKPGKTYCSRACGCKYRQRIARKIDPDELAELNKVRWLSRDQMAKMLGVSRHGINNVISRHGLSRFLPEKCKVKGCGATVERFKNAWGNMVGNMCQTHRREAGRGYKQRWRKENQIPATPEHRSTQARNAARAFWDNATPDQIAERSRKAVATMRSKKLEA